MYIILWECFVWRGGDAWEVKLLRLGVNWTSEYHSAETYVLERTSEPWHVTRPVQVSHLVRLIRYF
jgi:hypothetical protein